MINKFRHEYWHFEQKKIICHINVVKSSYRERSVVLRRDGVKDNECWTRKVV